MTKHEDINIPKINKIKTFSKLAVVLLIPLAILVIPLIYGLPIDMEAILSAGIALAGLIYVTYFIIGRQAKL